jgi:hypothetical protein
MPDNSTQRSMFILLTVDERACFGGVVLWREQSEERPQRPNNSIGISLFNP